MRLKAGAAAAEMRVCVPPALVSATDVAGELFESVRAPAVAPSVMPAPAVIPFMASAGPTPSLTSVSVPPALVSVVLASEVAIVIDPTASVRLMPAPAVKPLSIADPPVTADGMETTPPADVMLTTGVNEQSDAEMSPDVRTLPADTLTGREGVNDWSLIEAKLASNPPVVNSVRSVPSPESLKNLLPM